MSTYSLDLELPTEVLAEVFEYVGPNLPDYSRASSYSPKSAKANCPNIVELALLSQSCRMAVSYSDMIWKCVEAVSWNADDLIFSGLLSSRCSTVGVDQITMVWLDKATQAQDLRSMIRIPNVCDALTGLKIYSCPHVDDECLSVISKLGKLQLLDISSCPTISDDGMEHLGDLTNLTHLNLSWCSQIGDYGIRWLETSVRLEMIDLEGLSEITAAGIQFLQGATDLKHINLSSCENITDSALECLAPIRGSLQELNLSWCVLVTDSGMRHIRELHELRHLTLSWCTEISSEGLINLMWLKKLEVLHLNSCSGIDDHGMEFVSELAKSLRVLDIGNNGNIGDGGVSWLYTMQELHSLDISMCSRDLGNRSLVTLGKLPKLKELKIAGNTRLDPSAVPELKDVKIIV